MSQQRHRLSLAIGSFVLSLIHSPHIHQAPVLGAMPGSEDTVVSKTRHIPVLWEVIGNNTSSDKQLQIAVNVLKQIKQWDELGSSEVGGATELVGSQRRLP